MTDQDKKNAKLGKKIEPEEVAKIDPAKLGEAVEHQPPEVEGQYLYVDYITCPWCANTIRMQLESTRYVGWHCQNCGNYYNA